MIGKESPKTDKLGRKNQLKLLKIYFLEDLLNILNGPPIFPSILLSCYDVHFLIFNCVLNSIAQGKLELYFERNLRMLFRFLKMMMTLL